MIKYSLQNECLENIEAFSDEQMNREMAVIESVLEIYDKTILMMELSNSDVDIPDCSMFMESTFFQEGGDQPAENSQTTEGGNPAPPTEGQPQSDTQPTNNGDNNQDASNKPMTEEERKAHNKEHWIRQTNKKGKVENIFISIIAFIPRFFMFLGRCVKKLFTKTSDKAKDDAVKKADENMQNMTPEQISEAVKNAKDSQSAENTDQSAPQQGSAPQQTEQTDTGNIGEIDVYSKTWAWYNTDNVLTGIRKCMETLTNIQNNIDSYMDKQTAELKTQIDNCQPIIKNALSSDKLVQMRGTDVVASKDSIKAELGKFGTLCETLAKTFENKKDTFFKIIERTTDKNAKINAVKQSCDALKTFCKMTSKSLDNIYKAYEKKVVSTASAINNAAGNSNPTNSEPQQNQQRQPQQPPVSNGGGENNGG